MRKSSTSTFSLDFDVAAVAAAIDEEGGQLHYACC